MDEKERIDALRQHNEWSELFKKDPEAFEKMRRDMVEEVIKNAPPFLQLKLRAIQARFDKRMRTAGCKENRLVIAHSMLMEMFIEQFNPTMQRVSKELDDLWKNKE